MKLCYIVPKELWDKIIEALESARFCDHDKVASVLNEIEKDEYYE